MGSTDSTDAKSMLRPWRKRTLQIITTDIWRKDSSEEVEPLQQVAGHGSHDTKQAILTKSDGCILKPIQAPPRGHRELNFYRDIFNNEKHKEFQTLLPKFFGTCKRRVSGSDLPKEFLVIENLTAGYRKPCIMDIKVGAITYGPDASEEKIRKQESSYSGTKKPFGFSVPGLSVYSGESKDNFAVYDKEYGKTLNEANITEFVDKYLDSSTNLEASKIMADIFATKLRTVQRLFSEQTEFHLFGSSLLFVYDAETVHQLDKEQMEASTKLKMIDFAHVWPGKGLIDANYLNGVNNLVQIFTKHASQT